MCTGQLLADERPHAPSPHTHNIYLYMTLHESPPISSLCFPSLLLTLLKYVHVHRKLICYLQPASFLRPMTFPCMLHARYSFIYLHFHPIAGFYFFFLHSCLCVNTFFFGCTPQAMWFHPPTGLYPFSSTCSFSLLYPLKL